MTRDSDQSPEGGGATRLHAQHAGAGRQASPYPIEDHTMTDASADRPVEVTQAEIERALAEGLLDPLKPDTYQIGNELFRDLRAFLCSANVDPAACRITIEFPDYDARTALTERLRMRAPPIGEFGRVSGAQAGNHSGTWQNVPYRWEARPAPVADVGEVERLLSNLRSFDPKTTRTSAMGMWLENNHAALIAALRRDGTDELRATELETLRTRAEKMAAALRFIADTPDPGEDKERSATFYRIHAAMMKQIAAKALGRQTVSQEALDWAEEWFNSGEGERAALTEWEQTSGTE